MMMKKIVEWFKRQIALIKWSPSRTFREAWDEAERTKNEFTKDI